MNMVFRLGLALVIGWSPLRQVTIGVGTPVPMQVNSTPPPTGTSIVPSGITVAFTV